MAVPCFVFRVVVFTDWHLDADAEIIVLSKRPSPALSQTIILPAHTALYGWDKLPITECSVWCFEFFL